MISYHVVGRTSCSTETPLKSSKIQGLPSESIEVHMYWLIQNLCQSSSTVTAVYIVQPIYHPSNPFPPNPWWLVGVPKNPLWPLGAPENPLWPVGAPENPWWPVGAPENPWWPVGAAENPRWPLGAPENPWWPVGAPENP